MSGSSPVFRADDLSVSAAGIRLAGLSPLLDGAFPQCHRPEVQPSTTGWTVTWSVADDSGARFVLAIEPTAEGLQLDFALEGLSPAVAVESIGLRFDDVSNAVRYLRNGYTSWDGSYFVETEAARGIVDADPRSLSGFAMTALISRTGDTAVIGFLRHNRFQSRYGFSLRERAISMDVETLIDRVAHDGRVAAERFVVLAGSDTEETLRRWARLVAAAVPGARQVPTRRISGWCSWYSLYAAIDEPIILEHLHAAARFREQDRVPLDIFQIDDGFTPEMGDWLDVKPQFPRGMKPLLADIRAAGFTPGLWIAPFMVGNRSRLYAAHPDWVVADASSGKPIAPMTFYGEFRWHKRSEEYYVLDITHPAAAEYLRKVLRVWRHDWGCGYFKTDFMYFGSEYGPGQARWHVAGLSRMEIWMRAARLIREEIGDALWLSCGGPIWSAAGLVDAVRIGRDVGVSWKGHYSAESLLRDQTSRNFANGILWQADPDCILLRDRFHHLTDEQVRTLALFAGLAGGVLMTSDQLDEVPADRRALFAEMARQVNVQPCDFPLLGQSPLRHHMGVAHTGLPALISEGDPMIVQRVRRPDGSVLLALLNTGDTAIDRTISWPVAGSHEDADVQALDPATSFETSAAGIKIKLPPYATRVLVLSQRKMLLA